MHEFIMDTNKINHKIYMSAGKKVSIDPETLKTIEAIIKRYPDGKQKSALLPLLHILQEESGNLDVDTLDFIAELLGLLPVEVYEVATFYTQYYLQETGRFVIEVCHTGPCAACGAEEIISILEEKLGIIAGDTTPDKIFTLKTVECLGSCGTAPVMQVNTMFYEQLNREKIDQILEYLRNNFTKEPLSEEKWAVKFCSNI